MTDPNQLFSVTDKRVLVTGGTQGIGLMIAEGFVRAGAHVTVVGRDAKRCEDAAAGLSRLGSCAGIACELTEEADRQRLIAELTETDDGLDVLINNAATIWGAPLDDYPRAAWEKVLDVNVVALFELTRLALGLLRRGAERRPPARVINIGSADGIRPPAWETYAYSASKAAVHMLTRHLAARLALEQITVNAIAPGPFPTRKVEFAMDESDQLASMVPLGRLGTAADAAGTAIFLAAEAGSYLTGAIVPLDGGMSNRDPGSTSPPA